MRIANYENTHLKDGNVRRVVSLEIMIQSYQSRNDAVQITLVDPNFDDLDFIVIKS